MNWREWLKKTSPLKIAPARAPVVAPGVHHFQRERDGRFVRYHLRVDPDGSALLLAAASELVRLSPGQAWAANELLSGSAPSDVAATLQHSNAPDFVEHVDEVIRQLGQPSGRYPVFNLPDPAVTEGPVRLMAPFLADVAPGPLETLRTLLDRLWEAGIPHVRLLRQWDTDDEVLERAVEHAEDLGMIAGVRATAASLADNDLVRRLASVGLDYVVVPWGVSPELHARFHGDADYASLPRVVQEIRTAEMTPVVETPLLPQTVDRLEEQLPMLIDQQIENVEVFAVAREGDAPEQDPDDELTALAAPQLRQVAAWIQDLSNELPLQLIWLPPQASTSDQDLTQRASRGPRCGGDVAIRVSADGEVIPPRGPNASAGNLLRDRWKSIWGHPVFRRYRDRVEQATRCDQCPGLAICAADCPADPRGWAHD